MNGSLRAMVLFSCIGIMTLSCTTDTSECLEADICDPASDCYDPALCNDPVVDNPDPDLPGTDTLDNPPVVELPDGLYENAIYASSDVTRTKNLEYSQDASLTYDYYEVTENPDTLRPIVLLAPGGGYTGYTQEDKLHLVAEDLAKRGYVVALVRYSIDQQDIDTYIQSVKDMKTAIRFFKSKAEALKLNPEEVFIGGWSTGANISLHAAYFTEDEMSEVADPDLRNMMESGLDEHGFEGTEYLEYSADVKGVVAMMCYIFGETIIDDGESALMMINHRDATLSDAKTKIIGAFEANTISQFGTDIIFARALNQNFTQGEDLEYIKMTGAVEGTFGANYASLSTENCDAMATFFYNQMN